MTTDERNDFVMRHLGLVRSIIRRIWDGRGIHPAGTWEDFVQEGALALVRAADSFDESREGADPVGYAWGVVYRTLMRYALGGVVSVKSSVLKKDASQRCKEAGRSRPAVQDFGAREPAGGGVSLLQSVEDADALEVILAIPYHGQLLAEWLGIGREPASLATIGARAGRTKAWASLECQKAVATIREKLNDDLGNAPRSLRYRSRKVAAG